MSADLERVIDDALDRHTAAISHGLQGAPRRRTVSRVSTTWLGRTPMTEQPVAYPGAKCHCITPGSSRRCPTHQTRITRFIYWLDQDLTGGRWAWVGVALIVGLMGGALLLGWWKP